MGLPGLLRHFCPCHLVVLPSPWRPALRRRTGLATACRERPPESRRGKIGPRGKSWGWRKMRKTLPAARSIWVGLSLIVSTGAGGSLAMAQNAVYDPQQGSGDGRYQVPHTGILNGKFWTDTRYRYEFVDQGNLPKDARASTLKNKTGVESGFFHGFRAGVEGEFVVEVGPDDFNNTINGKTEYPIVADVQSGEGDQAYLESYT